MNELTSNQSRLLRFLTESRSPTQKEICHAFGWASTTSARSVLAALERKGYIRINRRQHRGIEVVKQDFTPKKEGK